MRIGETDKRTGAKLDTFAGHGHPFVGIFYARPGHPVGTKVELEENDEGAVILRSYASRVQIAWFAPDAPFLLTFVS